MAFEGLTRDVEFCEDNSGSAQKMRYFQKIERAGPRAPPLDLQSTNPSGK